MISRRSLITGLIAFGFTPAIVRASSLMPVKVMEPLLPAPVFGQIVFRFHSFKPVPLYHPDGRPLTGGDLVAGEVICTVYDGMRWVLI